MTRNAPFAAYEKSFDDVVHSFSVTVKAISAL